MDKDMNKFIELVYENKNVEYYTVICVELRRNYVIASDRRKESEDQAEAEAKIVILTKLKVQLEIKLDIVVSEIIKNLKPKNT